MKHKTILAAAIAGLLTCTSCELSDGDHHSSDPETQAAVEYASFKYQSFGNPNVSKCKEDPNVQIKNFKHGANGMSYQWASASKLETWGLTDPGNAGALAVAGYLGSDGVWRFAKFDWISSNRLTRDYANIKGRYNGFDYNTYMAAPKRGFFIMKADGSRRTNIIFDK